MHKKKVKILTWHYYMNFGSALQAYALQESVKRLGYKVEILNYRNPKFGRESSLKTIIKYLTSKLLKNVFQGRLYYPFTVFQREKLLQTLVVYEKENLAKICQNTEAIICGSDQIWAPNVFNSVYMLDFVQVKHVKKISYAASIGLPIIPDELVEQYKTLLLEFSSIAVREKSGKEILDAQCDIKANVVLDPTMLLDPEEYQGLEIPISQHSDKYVFCYFLNKNHEYKKQVEEYASRNNLKIVGVSSRLSDKEWMKLHNNIGPGEFLWLIHHASAIFTDSYHGTIFSMLYHKNFFVFERFQTDDPINQNSRIYQLDEYFKISGRILSKDSHPEDCNSFNYEVFEKKLAIERGNSLNYLKGALK